MSKRNFKLFIIILILVIVAVYGFLYLRAPKDEGGVSPTNFLAKFNPFGKSKKSAPPPGETSEETGGDIPLGEGSEAKLRLISSMPVAGFGVFQKERIKDVLFAPTLGDPTSQQGEPLLKEEISVTTEFVPALRYVEKATGNIYQTFADKIEEQKFSKTLIPRVYEASFGKNAESVILRYLKTDDRTIVTFAGGLPKENLNDTPSLEREIAGTFLPENISDIVLSPDKSQVFYLLNIGEGVVGITSGILGDKKVQVFDSPFAEWLSQWPNVDMITITTKPSAGVPGYMYTINPNKKDLNKALDNINGLTTLTSPDGKLVLWSDNSLSLGIYDIETQGGGLLNAKTLPEKCVWNNTSEVIYCSVPKFPGGSSFPDTWYKGEISFSDEIWKIDVATQSGAVISDLTSSRGIEDMDNIKLALDQDESYLFFINKKDSRLWELKLK
ncbi:MAG: hypothetical protein Q8O46_01460 [bacterium]|nr:hypothetical protein [bacterium]